MELNSVEICNYFYTICIHCQKFCVMLFAIVSCKGMSCVCSSHTVARMMTLETNKNKPPDEGLREQETGC